MLASNADNAVDRRNVERIECKNVKMAYKVPFSPFLPGLHRRSRRLPVKDLSRKGMSFYSNEELKVGQEIKVQIILHSGVPSETVKARICDVTPGDDRIPFRIGADFIAASPRTWKMLCHIHKEVKRSKKRDLFEGTRAGYALKHCRIMGEWRGRESRMIEGFPVEGHCRFIYAVSGAKPCKFGISAFKQNSPSSCRTLVSKPNIDGIKEGAFDIRTHGLLSFKVETGGPYPVHWLVVASGADDSAAVKEAPEPGRNG